MQQLHANFERWATETFGNPEQFRGFVRALDPHANAHLAGNTVVELAHSLKGVHRRMGLSDRLAETLNDLVGEF